MCNDMYVDVFMYINGNAHIYVFARRCIYVECVLILARSPLLKEVRRDVYVYTLPRKRGGYVS